MTFTSRILAGSVAAAVMTVATNSSVVTVQGAAATQQDDRAFTFRTGVELITSPRR